ncbi:hypothetical protein MMC25_008288 [Agyrium rufum]|nr:hypothetical protein [Agyrium rufum]
MVQHQAFFYGTLMAPQVLHRVCSGTSTPSTSHTERFTIQPAILHDYRRHRVRHADYPAILPISGSSVRGVLVSGLSDRDVLLLDVFEGDQYVRRKVKVRLLEVVGEDEVTGNGNVEGEEVSGVQTYVWCEKESELEDREWDFGEFRREKMGRWVGGHDEEYLEVDQAVNYEGKDPTGGRGVGGDIAGQLNKASVEEEEEVLESAV